MVDFSGDGNLFLMGFNLSLVIAIPLYQFTIPKLLADPMQLSVRYKALSEVVINVCILRIENSQVVLH